MTTHEQPRDHENSDESGNAKPPNNIEANVKSKSTWLRLFYMLVIGLCYAVSRFVFFPVVLLQFFWVLFTGETNQHLHSISQWLASYTYHSMMYLAFNTDEKPFPFNSAMAAVAPADG